jgi:beta-galactosidase/beta-glucuronidase
VSLLAHPALHLAVPGGVYVTTPHIALTASDGLRADATVAVNVTVANARGTTAAGAGARVELFDERGVSLGVGFASLPEVGGGGGSASVLLSFDARRRCGAEIGRRSAEDTRDCPR